MSTNIGISNKNSKAVVGILSRLLADEYVLYTKTRNAHWNIEDADFHDKHKFFESLYEESDEYIDDVAERIRSIGHYAPATLKLFMELTHLTENSRNKNDSKGFIKELLADHESIIIYLRENINKIGNDLADLGTCDFITGLLEKHEKTAWFLRSHLA
jgi:starvation-inducible DNA-binding protein